MTCQIICPTHGRAGRVKTFDVFGQRLRLCVSEGQEPLYRAEYPDANFLVHPDTVVGLAAKRQWIYEWATSIDCDVFMVDDDVNLLMDMQKMVGERARISDPQTAWDLIQRTCDIAEDFGAYLFGFSQTPDPATFRPQRPFRTTGFVGGHALGMRHGSKLWFPQEGMHGSEDMWISALNAHHHRFVFIDQRYCFPQVGTFRGKGGQAAMRTMGNLRKNYEVLTEAFGPAITHKKPTMRAALAHEWQITLQVPW